MLLAIFLVLGSWNLFFFGYMKFMINSVFDLLRLMLMVMVMMMCWGLLGRREKHVAAFQITYQSAYLWLWLVLLYFFLYSHSLFLFCLDWINRLCRGTKDDNFGGSNTRFCKTCVRKRGMLVGFADDDLCNTQVLLSVFWSFHFCMQVFQPCVV